VSSKRDTKKPDRSTHVVQVHTVRAKYDAAKTTLENRRHWADADGLSAYSAANPADRRTLRNRARYEFANNPYGLGLLLTIANYVIGTGPRLQMLLGNGENGAENGLNGFIERQFASWSKAVGLPRKLRTAEMTKVRDGEVFVLLFTNPNIPHPIKLDVRLIEGDQITSASQTDKNEASADGIVFDEYGNPREYLMLRFHPGGDMDASTLDQETVRVPAASMIHWFRADRPGQYRGVPEFTASLSLFAMLRRLTQSVITAAESAANVAIFMKTALPPGGEAAAVPMNSTMDFDRNMAVFGPEGWEPSQIKAEQPATTYAMGKREFLSEIGRPWSAPYMVIACDASGHNFSSARMDNQVFQKTIRVEQSDFESTVIDRIFAAWMIEAIKVYEELAGRDADLESWPHQWFWDGFEHVDPSKEANAQETRLKNNTTTLEREYAKEGKDWEVEVKQRGREISLLRKEGITSEQAAPKPSTPPKDESDDHEE